MPCVCDLPIGILIQLQQKLCIVFQHDSSSDLNDEVLELRTNSHMHSTLLGFALVTVNNKSHLASSQWSCIL